jgi:hypothetical protein
MRKLKFLTSLILVSAIGTHAVTAKADTFRQRLQHVTRVADSYWTAQGYAPVVPAYIFDRTVTVSPEIQSDSQMWVISLNVPVIHVLRGWLAPEMRADPIATCVLITHELAHVYG